jgi:hypothetical protein
MEPMFTADLDIIVLVDTDEEYVEVFRKVSAFAEGQEGMHHILGGVPVQIFPTTVKPLYREALNQARHARIGNLRVKIASPEYLILLYLEAFRDRDRERIRRLLPMVDVARLHGLLAGFDNEEGLLARRFQTLR